MRQHWSRCADGAWHGNGTSRAHCRIFRCDKSYSIPDASSFSQAWSLCRDVHYAMCFQGFVYFACGHDRIVTQNCELANDHPLFMHSACPQYNQHSSRPRVGCGVGKFYCAETEDGPFLDQAHITSSQAKLAVLQVDLELGRVQAAGASFHSQADAQNISLERRAQAVEYKQLTAHFHYCTARRQRSLHEQTEADAIINQAITYYRQKAQHFRTVSDNQAPYPPLVLGEGLGHRIPEVQDAQHWSTGMARLESTQPAVVSPGDRSPTISPHSLAMQHLRSVDEYRHDLRHTLNHGNQETTRAPNAQDLPVSDRLFGPIRPTVKRQNVHDTVRPSSAIKKFKQARMKQETPERAGGPVRRSARVRTKPVTYVDPSSPVHSREVSPEASDFSGLSPEKSDVSSSPSRRGGNNRKTSIVREVSSSSLGGMIGEWKKRHSSSDLPRFQQCSKPAVYRPQRPDRTLPPLTASARGIMSYHAGHTPHIPQSSRLPQPSQLPQPSHLLNDHAVLSMAPGAHHAAHHDGGTFDAQSNPSDYNQPTSVREWIIEAQHQGDMAFRTSLPPHVFLPNNSPRFSRKDSAVTQTGVQADEAMREIGGALCLPQHEYNHMA